jgi:hypothetical protein
MKKAGFDYYPVPYAGSMTQVVHPYLARSSYLVVPVLDSNREQVEKWGYGFDSESDEGVFAGQAPEVAEAEAKNEAYVQSLGTSAQHEYWYSLYGPDFGSEENRGKDVKGCAGKAISQVPYNEETPPSTGFQDQYRDLFTQITDVTRWDVGMDLRAVKLDGEWEQCATAKGLNFSTMVFKDPLRGEPVSDASFLNRPSPGIAIDMARSLDANGELVKDGSGLLQGLPTQIEVALIDFDCRTETDYMSRVMEIQRDVEQAFLDQNREKLDELMVAATDVG